MLFWVAVEEEDKHKPVFPRRIYTVEKTWEVGSEVVWRIVADVRTSTSKVGSRLARLKVVLLHLWRVNVKTTGGFICISLGDFYTDKIVP